MTAPPGSTTAEVAAALRQAGLADVGESTLQRALYSSDASLYRVVPEVVAYPRDTGEVAAVVEVCGALGVPLTCRGAGTSIAGNAVGAGVILEFSKHLNRVLSVDPDAGTAVVQPGVVQARLQRAAAPLGLRFGPDPSTHNRCTIGGMIGNNACGSRSLAYGRTSDNVEALDVLTAAGRALRLVGPAALRAAGSPSYPQLAALRATATGGLAAIRTEFGRFGRQVSGYALEHLLPERGFDVRRALVGSEGTLAVVTGATLRLVPTPAHRVLAVVGYPDMATAADAVPGILQHAPSTCEGLDSRIVEVVRARRGPSAVPTLPRGSGWLFAEVTADTEAEALGRARRLVSAADAAGGMVISDPRHASALWRIREDGAGLAGRTGAGKPAYPGWEDSAVPPAALGSYLRELEELLRGYGLSGVPYGHFGDGCLHLRLDFPLEPTEGGTRSRTDGRARGRAVLRAFAFDAAQLVTRYGGSLSGEHGDGRTRSELLPIMYSPAALTLFRQVKSVWDPGNLLNPGVIVDPSPVDADLRAAGSRPVRASLGLAHHRDGGDFAAAVHRCTGVGKCVADTTAAGGVMCPSYLATRDEKDSTRGRARVLQEMVNGSLVAGGWRAPEVAAVLDLCLSCKACSSECPAAVDMATYKAEILHQAYRRRLRPRTHYTLGWLPRWARLAALAPGLVNRALASPTLGRAAKFTADIDQRRTLPSFATSSNQRAASASAPPSQRRRPRRSINPMDRRRVTAALSPGTFRTWYARNVAADNTGGTPVMLFVDTFTNYFSPEIGIAAVRVLTGAGFSVTIPRRPVCCAITWISTGQLDAARRILRRTAAELAPAVEAGIPIVGLEPSCTATLRSDAVELLGTQSAESLAAAVRTMGEVLTAAPGWSPPSLTGTKIVAQPHCHHRAVMGWDADAVLLQLAGAELTRVGGCCGLAGNFGVERGHYEVSAAVAETALLPAVRAAGPGAVLLADGFSCRTQLADLAGQPSVHLAQLLAARLPAPRHS